MAEELSRSESAIQGTRPKKKRATLPLIGWREWVGLPDFGVDRIKAKIDTGARSSSLHAYNLRRFEKDGIPQVRFEIHPVQRRSQPRIEVVAPVLEERKIRSSNGSVSLRPVIEVQIALLGLVWPIELTLANRDDMGFRMLLGREALRGRFVIDCGRSYFGRRGSEAILSTAVGSGQHANRG